MNDFRCHVSSSRYIRCVIRTIGRLIESNALNSENRISICARYDGPIAFGVKLASFLVLFPVNIHPCYLSYIFHSIIIIQPEVSWKGHRAWYEKCWFRGNELKRYFRSRRQTRLLSSHISFLKLETLTKVSTNYSIRISFLFSRMNE